MRGHLFVGLHLRDQKASRDQSEVGQDRRDLAGPGSLGHPRTAFSPPNSAGPDRRIQQALIGSYRGGVALGLKFSRPRAYWSTFQAATIAC